MDHDSGVTTMALDDDCELLVTGTKDGQICVWEMQDLYSATIHSIHQSKFTVCNQFITISRSCNLDPPEIPILYSKPGFTGVYIIFLIFSQNIRLLDTH